LRAFKIEIDVKGLFFNKIMPGPKDPIEYKKWKKRQSEDAVNRYIKYPNLKKQVSEKMKGKKRSPFSKKHRENLSEALKGKPKSKDHKEKIKKARMGTKLSKITKVKQSETHKGEKNPNWQGGISDILYPDDWTDILRESIRQRDGYICQMCGIHQDELNGFYKKIDIHHIDYNKDNLNPKNLISLCRGCHLKTNYNREYWINYFKGRV